jgi:hypothetical protein
MQDTKMINRGLIPKDTENKSEIAHDFKRKKTIYKDIDDFAQLEAGDDKHALGSVESGGSFFNQFKPREGVTVIEGRAKVKKGPKIASMHGHLTRQDYSKSYSQKPFELKGILTNSQSMGNLAGPRKSQGISFYEESSLPPIMSPRGNLMKY